MSNGLGETVTGDLVQTSARERRSPMKRWAIVLMLILMFAVACARTVWSKYGATLQDYNVDSYQCERDARQSGYFGGGIAGAIAMQDFFGRCMVSKGWEAQRQ